MGDNYCSIRMGSVRKGIKLSALSEGKKECQAQGEPKDFHKNASLKNGDALLR
jgi:hypothetical protein